MQYSTVLFSLTNCSEIASELVELERSGRSLSDDVSRHTAISRLIGQQTQRDVNNTSSRPEQVLVEVNALIERRPVTSVLETQQFRQSLENSLRRAVNSVCRHGDESSPWQPAQQQQQQQQQQATADSDRDHGVTSSTATESGMTFCLRSIG